MGQFDGDANDAVFLLHTNHLAFADHLEELALNFHVNDKLDN